MIINVSARTDIPAYYSEWFMRRIAEGYVYVRNPYYPNQITKYLINPEVVDSLVFCTKNPRPMLKYIDQLQSYHPYFFITITPYDQSIEPHVPLYQEVIKDFQKLSKCIGKKAICLRYDPIFINNVYTIEKHISYFQQIVKSLHNYTNVCIISFIDLYTKTKRNFPNIQPVSLTQQYQLAAAFSKIAAQYQIQIKTCAEEINLSRFNISQEGCITKRILRDVIGGALIDQKCQPLRKGCHCYPSRDIGEYNTCLHGCLYCYANEDKQAVIKKYQQHDTSSPLLIGHVEKEDIIKQAKQVSYKERQLSLDI